MVDYKIAPLGLPPSRQNFVGALRRTGEPVAAATGSFTKQETDTGQTFEPLEVELVVNLYRKRKRAVTFFIDTSDGQQETPRAFKNKNILAEAVEYSDYLKTNPSCTHATIARHFNTQRERVSRLLSLVRRLPSDFVEQVVHYPDTVLIGNDVTDIAKIKNHQKQQTAIDRLLLTANEKIP